MGRPRKPVLPGQEMEQDLDQTVEQTEAYQNAFDNGSPQTEPVVFDSFAYTVVRVNDMYQFVRIPFNKRTHSVGAPELVAESTDRYEIESKFAVELDYQIFYIEQFEK
jgi:hypothetical protein